jgi:hypothetical protein
MSDKLLLGLLYVDKKFKKPRDIEQLRPHIELIFKIASERENFSEEELYLFKKLLYKLERYSEFLNEKLQLLSDKFKIEGRL